MSVEPRTWIVGCSDGEGLTTRCLLSLQERYALPETVTLCFGEPSRQVTATEPGRVLAIIADPPGAAGDFLGLLREAEAQALLNAPTPATTTVAVGVARGRSNPVDDAVNLAVTTLIDWGHEVSSRA